MLDKNGVLLLTSRSSLPKINGQFLSGTLVRGRRIYDGEGWIENTDWHDRDIGYIADCAYGRYLLINNHIRKLQVVVDDSGSEPLFLYRSLHGWGVSNSLYCIVEFVKRRNWPLTLNEASLAAVFIDHSIGRTMFSPRTVYNEITLLPLDSIVEISKGSGTCHISQLQKPQDQSDGYEDRLVDWILRWRGILSAVSLRDSRSPMLLDLSGGVDSRMVLSLVLPNKALSCARVHTQKNSIRDAEIAMSLGSLFGFEVGHYAPTVENADVNEQFEKYLIGNLNFYHMPVKPVLLTEPSDIFKINGIGGEVIRDFYPGSGAAWISRVPKILPVELGRYTGQVKALLRECFRMYGVDPESRTAMREHYRQLRSRIHGGRRLHEKFKFKFLSPLLDREFQKLAYVKGAPDPEGIYRDVLLCGGGLPLASHPFDHKKKNFSESFCRESSFYRSNARSILEGEMEEFSYVRVEPQKFRSVELGVDLSTSGDFRNMHCRLEHELSELLRLHAEEALPSDFRKIPYSTEGSSSGRKKELRDVVWFSVITACLNTL